MDQETKEAIDDAKKHFEYGQPEWLKTLLLKLNILEANHRATDTIKFDYKLAADSAELARQQAAARVTQLESYIVSICQEKALHGSAPSTIAGAIRLGIPTLDAALFEHMEGEVTPLQKARAELEKLKVQHEELRVSAENWLRQRNLAIDREEALRTRVVELEADVACKHVTLDEVPGGILLCGHLDDSPLRPFMTELVKQRDALQAFKTFVHARLDKAGVPVDPPGEHRDAGCRIGQRLDLVLGQKEHLVQILAKVITTCAEIQGGLLFPKTGVPTDAGWTEGATHVVRTLLAVLKQEDKHGSKAS